jgi:hypothetical protein
MLEYDNSQEVLESLWTTLGCRIELPSESEDFFAAKGPQNSLFAGHRQHLRYDFRDKALLIHQGTTYAVYTKDISHASIGFLHFQQLFPLERVRMYLANGAKLDLTIRRCLRLQASCFECGGQIEETDRMTVKQLRELFFDSL